MLIHAGRSCLLVIDIQERLIGVIQEGQQMVVNCGWLMQIAGTLNVPVLISEQYPQGLGRTISDLLALAPADAFMEKVHFSCVTEPAARERIDASGRDQLILVGTEAHVCVLQTALGLLEAGKEVYVVEDCVSSRHLRNKELAIERMRAEGVRVVSREMVAYEWLGVSGNDCFREINRKFLRDNQ